MDIGEVIAVVVPAIVVSALTPLALHFLSARSARAVIKAREEREDLVAARAAEAVRMAKESADKAAHLMGRTVALSAANGDKLEVIHLLVNSNMTAAKQAQYDATVLALAVTKELIDIRRATGNLPSVKILNDVASAEKKIADLRVDLDERNRQAKVVAAQQEIQRQAGGDADKQAEAAETQLEAAEKQMDAAEKRKDQT